MLFRKQQDYIVRSNKVDAMRETMVPRKELLEVGNNDPVTGDSVIGGLFAAGTATPFIVVFLSIVGVSITDGVTGYAAGAIVVGGPQFRA